VVDCSDQHTADSAVSCQSRTFRKLQKPAALQSFIPWPLLLALSATLPSSSSTTLLVSSASRTGRSHSGHARICPFADALFAALPVAAITSFAAVMCVYTGVSWELFEGANHSRVTSI
jgi:hypothetical protein